MAEKHSAHWVMHTFAPYHIVRVVEMGPGYALCEFPKDMVNAVITAFNNVKVDGKKLVVKISKKYPPPPGLTAA